MPVKVIEGLPAIDDLRADNIFVMNDERIQVIDKFKSLFIKWGRILYLTGCIILIVGCMFS